MTSARNHIKISCSEDEAPTRDVEFTAKNNMTSHQGSYRPGTSEPIEIHSDEDLQDCTSTSPIVTRSDSRLRSHTKPNHRPTKVVEQTIAASAADEQLEYPESDSESHEEEPTRFTKSSYFVPVAEPSPSRQDLRVSAQTPVNKTQRTTTEDMSCVSADNALRRAGMCRDEADFSLTENPSSDHVSHKYPIVSFGNFDQIDRRGWSLYVSKDGFRFFEPTGTEEKAYFADVHNINNWFLEDKYCVVHVLLKFPIRPISSTKELYITLEHSTSHQFIRMLQSERTQGLFSKLSTTTERDRKAICQESATKFSDRSSRSHRPQRIIPLTVEPETPTISRATKSTLKEDFERAKLDLQGISQPYPIPLPTSRAERALLVGKDEVHSIVQNQASVTCQDDWIAASPKTRTQTARLVEERNVRATGPSQAILVYPPDGPNSVTIFDNDLERLRPNEFLNDSIVDFYLRHNYDKLSEREQKEAFIFNTFFFSRLTKKRERGEKDNSYQAVKKWTSKGGGVDLFSKKFVVIPINENYHWFLAVVVNLDKVEFGADVGPRKRDTSWIRAEGDDGDENEFSAASERVSRPTSPAPEIDTTNLLRDLTPLKATARLSAAHESAPRVQQTQQYALPDVVECSRLSGSPTPEIRPLHIPSSIPDEKSTSRVIETPPPVAFEVTEFADSPQAKLKTRLSLTERIRAGECAKLPSRAIDLDSDPMAQLKIDDGNPAQSAIEATMRRNASQTKTTKTYRSKATMSKKGIHIPEDAPVIIIFDSLGNTHNRVYKVIKDYLVAEAMDKKQLVLDPAQFDTCLADVPTQDNFSDCGLFLIQYADRLLSQVPGVLKYLLNRFNFTTPAGLAAHKRKSAELWEISRISQRRAEMVQEIRELSIPWKKRNAEKLAQKKAERQRLKAEGTDASSLECEQNDVQEDSLTIMTEDPMQTDAAPSSPNVHNEPSEDPINCLL